MSDKPRIHIEAYGFAALVERALILARQAKDDEGRFVIARPDSLRVAEGIKRALVEPLADDYEVVVDGWEAMTRRASNPFLREDDDGA